MKSFGTQTLLVRYAMEGVGHENDIDPPRREVGDRVRIALDEFAMSRVRRSDPHARQIQHPRIDVVGADSGGRSRNLRGEKTIAATQVDDIQARRDPEFSEHLRRRGPKGGPPVAVRQSLRGRHPQSS